MAGGVSELMTLVVSDTLEIQGSFLGFVIGALAFVTE
jgi:hypothetical protein